MPWLSLTIQGSASKAARLATCPSARWQRSRAIPGAQSRARRFGRHGLADRTIHLRRRGAVTAVDLALFKRYARRRTRSAVPAARTAAIEADMTTFDKREEGFEKKFAHDE